MNQIPYVGELAAIFAAILWSFAMVTFRHYGKGVTASHLNLTKNTVALISLSISVCLIPVEWPRDMSVWFWLSVSGFIGLTISDNALFAALKILGAQASSALQLLIPPLTAMLAVLAIRERLDVIQILGMIITLVSIGGALYFRGSLPTWEGMERKTIIKGVALGVFAASSQAIGLVSARHVMVTTDVWVGTFIRVLSSVVGLLVLGFIFKPKEEAMAAIGENKTRLSKKNMGPLIIASFFGCYISLTLLTVSSRFTKAGITASLASTVPIWIIPISYFFLGERANWKSVSCTILAVLGVILIFF